MLRILLPLIQWVVSDTNVPKHCFETNVSVNNFPASIVSKTTIARGKLCIVVRPCEESERGAHREKNARCGHSQGKGEEGGQT